MHAEYVHHIDFAVTDLESAMANYRRIFGASFHAVEFLESRAVRVARFQVGRSWINLVQPVSDESPAMQVLRTRGPGFFHLAYAVADIEAAVQHLQKQGVRLLNSRPRIGLEGWKLIDIDSRETCGVQSQLVQQDQAK